MREFGADNGTLMAASVAFYLLLSVVPLALLAISVVGTVLGSSDQARAHVMTFLEQFLPGAQGTRVLSEAVDAVIGARGVVAGVGLAGLLSTALGGFATLETAINIIWHTPPRSFLWNKLFALGMMLVIGGLFLLSLATTAAVTWAGRLAPLAWLAQSWSLQVLGLVLPAVISGATFSFVYKWFPHTRTRWRPALTAGFLAGFLWEAFKVGYTFYSTKVDQSATYGTLGGIVGLVLWIYYSTALALLGAELSWVMSGCPEQIRPESGPGSTTGGG